MHSTKEYNEYKKEEKEYEIMLKGNAFIKYMIALLKLYKRM